MIIDGREASVKPNLMARSSSIDFQHRSLAKQDFFPADVIRPKQVLAVKSARHLDCRQTSVPGALHMLPLRFLHHFLRLTPQLPA